MVKKFDVILIGGGIAGLSLAIQLAARKIKTAVFEKKKFPFHRVCGEYVSMEAWGFLSDKLKLAISGDRYPLINRLMVSSRSGFAMNQKLDLGGIGISRYKLDYLLYLRARELGAAVHEEEEVLAIEGRKVVSKKGKYIASLIVGSFGKRSVLDFALKREHLRNCKKSRLANDVGVKYHIEVERPDNLIELHNFQNGYCGLSNVEGGKTCMCYLTAAENLRKAGGRIEKMEAEILSENPFLRAYFKSNRRLYRRPLTISRVDFSPKDVVYNGTIPMVGDAAGLIAPLAGNGMSMALKGSSILSSLIIEFLSGAWSRSRFLETYAREWKRNFGNRLKYGRPLQRVLRDPRWSGFSLRVLSHLSFLANFLIKQTHGKPF